MDSQAKAHASEQFSARMLEALGYNVRYVDRVAGISVDFIVEKAGTKKAVEVKSTTITLDEILRVAERLKTLEVTSEGFSPSIIIVFGRISRQAREWALRHGGFEFWGIEEIRRKVAPFQELSAELASLSDEPVLPPPVPDDLAIKLTERLRELCGKVGDGVGKGRRRISGGVSQPHIQRGLIRHGRE